MEFATKKNNKVKKTKTTSYQNCLIMVIYENNFEYLNDVVKNLQFGGVNVAAKIEIKLQNDYNEFINNN